MGSRISTPPKIVRPYLTGYILGTVYQADSDGEVIVETSTGSGNTQFYLKINPSPVNPPTTVRYSNGCGYSSVTAGVCGLVAKGDYWKVSKIGTADAWAVIYFRPFT